MNVTAELSKDRRIAAGVSLGVATLAVLILHFFTYRIPMPPLPEQLKYEDMEVEFIELTPESLPETANAGGGGGGDEVNAPQNDKFTEQTQEVLTTKGGSGKIPSGHSNHTNSPNGQNQSSTKNPSTNPFGDGGSGTGSGGGTGGGLGQDDGDGNGDGPSGGGSGNVPRKLIQSPSTRDIESDEDCKITFLVKINADGTIAGTPQVVRSKTTTGDQGLISRVTSLVKSQARYNAVSGAKVVSKEIVIRLEAR
jgi:hypothetical protein